MGMRSSSSSGCTDPGTIAVMPTSANSRELAAAKAGIDGVTFYSMRHAFVSGVIDRGITSTVLAALMGHESSTITERRYVHLFEIDGF